MEVGHGIREEKHHFQNNLLWTDQRISGYTTDCKNTGWTVVSAEND